MIFISLLKIGRYVLEKRFAVFKGKHWNLYNIFCFNEKKFEVVDKILYKDFGKNINYFMKFIDTCFFFFFLNLFAKSDLKSRKDILMASAFLSMKTIYIKSKLKNTFKFCSCNLNKFGFAL